MGDAPPQKRARTKDGRVLKFRNYQPKTDDLKENRLAPKEAPSVVIGGEVEKKLKAEITTKATLLNIAPQKPNADLKRDVAKKLKKLARRTQEAIRELIQEKMEAEEAGEYEDVMGEDAGRID